MNIDQLEAYFNSIELPKTVQLNSVTTISDVKILIESNISYLRAHPGNKAYLPYYDQLIEIKNVLCKPM